MTQRIQIAISRRRFSVTARVAAATAYVTSLVLDSLDSHSVNIMLPTLTRDFNAPLASVKWTVLGYVLALAIAMPVAPWLTARFGERRMFVQATLLFVLASAACGLAQSLPQLVAFRAIQGLGGGLVGPIATTILYRTYPQSERARMTRLLLMPIALGPALAPPLGGFLVDHLSWRIAFLINAPISLFTIATVMIGLKPDDNRETAPRLNIGAFLAAATALSGALYFLGEAPELGWADPLVLGVATITVIAALVFIKVEYRTRNPLLDLRLFAEPIFRYSNLATTFQTISWLGGLYYLTPLLLQEVGGQTPLVAGAVLSCIPVGVILSTQTVARGFERIGPRTLAVLGQVGLTVALLVLASFSGHTPIWAFCLVLFLAGVANGLSMVSLQAAMFADIGPGSLSRAATVFNVNRQFSTALGVGIATAIVTAGASGNPTSAGTYQIAFLVAAGFSLGAAIVGLALPRKIPPVTKLLPTSELNLTGSDGPIAVAG
ncbi:MAG: hypothetical protein JWM76_2913 [Pseudonocardiales bacterium]|nr:hypothetical protein [Pseudonocardiales bacterium]